MTFLTLTLLGAVEAAMLMFAGLRLMGTRTPLKLLVAAGLLASLGVRITRYLLYVVMGAPFGVHMVVVILMYFAMVRHCFGVTGFVAAAAVLVGFLILIPGTGLVLLVMASGVPLYKSPAVMHAVENLPLALATLAIWSRELCLIPTGLRLERGV